MTECFEAAVDFYKTVFPNVLENTECRDNVEIAHQVSRESADCFQAFSNIVVGNAARPFMSAMSFPQRFLKTTRLESEGSSVLEAAVKRLLYLGLLYHFVFMRFPTRHDIGSVNFDALEDRWLPETLVADLQFKPLIAGNRMLDGVFDAYYRSSGTESEITTRFSIGFLKRGLVRSFFRNIYYSGMLYALKYDLATGGVSEDSVRTSQ